MNTFQWSGISTLRQNCILTIEKDLDHGVIRIDKGPLIFFTDTLKSRSITIILCLLPCKLRLSSFV